METKLTLTNKELIEMPHAVTIVPYNPEWPLIADKTIQALRQIPGDNIIRIEHIGSTAVTGLAAKPVIDLLPLVKDLDSLDAQKDNIVKLGYLWHGEFGLAGRRFCTLTNAAGVRLVHLHFYQIDDVQIKRHLAFRDYLLTHPLIAQQYQEEKLRAAKLHPNDSMAYNDEKGPWIKHYEQEALKWYKSK